MLSQKSSKASGENEEWYYGGKFAREGSARSQLPRIKNDHLNEFALLHDGAIKDFFNDEDNAIKIGTRDHGEGILRSLLRGIIAQDSNSSLILLLFQIPKKHFSVESWIILKYSIDVGFA